MFFMKLCKKACLVTACGVVLLRLHHAPLALWALVYMIKQKYFLISCFVKLHSELRESGYVIIVRGISSPDYYTVLSVSSSLGKATCEII